MFYVWVKINGTHYNHKQKHQHRTTTTIAAATADVFASIAKKSQVNIKLQYFRSFFFASFVADFLKLYTCFWLSLFFLLSFFFRARVRRKICKRQTQNENKVRTMYKNFHSFSSSFLVVFGLLLLFFFLLIIIFLFLSVFLHYISFCLEFYRFGAVWFYLRG